MVLDNPSVFCSSICDAYVKITEKVARYLYMD